MDGSFSFSNTQVLLPMVMRYLRGKSNEVGQLHREGDDKKFTLLGSLLGSQTPRKSDQGYIRVQLSTVSFALSSFCRILGECFSLEMPGMHAKHHWPSTPILQPYLLAILQQKSLLPVDFFFHVGSVAAAIIGQEEPSITQSMNINLYAGTVHNDHIAIGRLTSHLQGQETGECAVCSICNSLGMEYLGLNLASARNLVDPRKASLQACPLSLLVKYGDN